MNTLQHIEEEITTLPTQQVGELALWIQDYYLELSKNPDNATAKKPEINHTAPTSKLEERKAVLKAFSSSNSQLWPDTPEEIEKEVRAMRKGRRAQFDDL